MRIMIPDDRAQAVLDTLQRALGRDPEARIVVIGVAPEPAEATVAEDEPAEDEAAEDEPSADEAEGEEPAASEAEPVEDESEEE